MDEDKGDSFTGLGWRAEIVSLADLHIPFNPLLKGGLNGAKQLQDDSKITPFSQSTQA